MMALKLANLRYLPIRQYSAEYNPLLALQNLNFETTVLPNKLVVASVENRSPVSRICIAYRAGARDEPLEHLGVSHVVRVAAGLSTKEATGFGVTRNLQQLGTNFYVTNDRETFSYCLEGSRDNIERGMPFLSDVACNPAFKPWEILDIIPRLKLELNNRSHPVRAMENLHKAAFHYGLGNSIYCKKYFLNDINPKTSYHFGAGNQVECKDYFLRDIDTETLMHYFNTNCVPSRAVVIGFGIEHSELVSYAQSLAIRESGQQTASNRTPSKYHGGEIRFDKGGELATFAIATQGASIKSRKEFLTYGILCKAFGTGSSVKWANESGSILAKNVGQHPKMAISAFNIGYSDNGLFGILATCTPDNAPKIVDGVLKTLKTGKLSDKEIMRGRNQMIASIAFDNENPRTQIEDSVSQLLNSGSYQNTEAVIKEIESITDSDVNNVAKKITTGKLSMSAYGRIYTVPFLNELKF